MNELEAAIETKLDRKRAYAWVEIIGLLNEATFNPTTVSSALRALGWQKVVRRKQGQRQTWWVTNDEAKEQT